MASIDLPAHTRALSIGAIASAAAIFLASLSPAPWIWGLNSSAFLPAAARAVVYALLLTAAGLVLVDGRSARMRRPAPTRRAAAPVAAAARRGARFGRAAALTALTALALLFWLLRDRAHLLGDGLIYLDNIVRGARPLYSEPLAANAWYSYARLLQFVGVAPTEATLSTLSIICGVLATALCWGIASRLFPRRAERLAATGFLLLSGSAELWFGYVECYPVAAVTVLLYLYCLLASSQAKAPPIAAGAALAVAISTHLAAVFLVPSYLVLLVRARPSRLGLVLALAAPPLLAALLLAGAGFRPESAFEPLRLVLGAAGLHGASGLGRIPAILGHRVWDLLNLLLLLMPVPLALLTARALSRARAVPHADPALGLLAAAAIPGALLVLALSLAVSPTQDWDLMAVPLLPAAALLAAAGARGLRGASPRLRAAWIALALASTLAFVLANADSAAAARRYRTLLAPSVLLSPHERAYGNEKLARFHRNRGDFETELLYDRQALAAEPGNARYWGATGLALHRLGRLSEAIPLMREATRMQPRNTEGLYYFGNLLLEAGRNGEAVEVLSRVVAVTGRKPDPLYALGAAYAALGDTARARQVVDSVLALPPRTLQTPRGLSGPKTEAQH